MEMERTFWAEGTPIGFVFRFGVGFGLVVGTIIVYQILYTDVSNHLMEYATLKALSARGRSPGRLNACPTCANY